MPSAQQKTPLIDLSDGTIFLVVKRINNPPPSRITGHRQLFQRRRIVSSIAKTAPKSIGNIPMRLNTGSVSFSVKGRERLVRRNLAISKLQTHQIHAFI